MCPPCQSRVRGSGAVVATSERRKPVEHRDLGNPPLLAGRADQDRRPGAPGRPGPSARPGCHGPGVVSKVSVPWSDSTASATAARPLPSPATRSDASAVPKPSEKSSDRSRSGSAGAPAGIRPRSTPSRCTPGPVDAPPVVLDDEFERVLLEPDPQRHQSGPGLASREPLIGRLETVMDGVDEELAERVGDPFEHLAVPDEFVADQFEADLLVGLPAEVAEQLGERVGDLGHGGRGQFDGLILDVAGIAARPAPPRRAGGTSDRGRRLDFSVGGGEHQRLQHLGVHPQRADGVDQPEQAGGIDPHGLAERPTVEGREEAAEVVGVGARGSALRGRRGQRAERDARSASASGTARRAADRARAGLRRRPSSASRAAISSGEPRSASASMAAGRAAPTRSTAAATLGSSILAMASSIGVPGIADGGEAHHPPGALDGVGFPAEELEVAFGGGSRARQLRSLDQAGGSLRQLC